VASGGGHGSQNEIRARLLGGRCGGGDHPDDQPEAQSATPMAAREIIYRPQHWNVY
jgi:hypothetical protein